MYDLKKQIHAATNYFPKKKKKEKREEKRQKKKVSRQNRIIFVSSLPRVVCMKNGNSGSTHWNGVQQNITTEQEHSAAAAAAVDCHCRCGDSSTHARHEQGPKHQKYSDITETLKIFNE